MTPRDLLLLYRGHAEPVLRIARTPASLWIGAVFVLSASLARNYDGKFLPAEPSVLFHGFAASIGNALLLWTLIYAVASWRKLEHAPPFGRGFLKFLGVFWMTAPLAWFYGIPFERFLSETEAIDANLWTLAAVAALRVLIITRVLSVLFSIRFAAVFFLVMLVADIEVLVASSLMRAPLVDFMGGLQHTEAEMTRVNIKFSAMFWSFITAPVWIIGALASLYYIRNPRWAIHEGSALTPSRTMRLLTAASLAIWIPGLLLIQPEHARRVRAERLLKAGDVQAAFAEMSRYNRDDYPPIWDPPPRISYREGTPSRESLRTALEKGAAPWVVELFGAKLARWDEVERFFNPAPLEPSRPTDPPAQQPAP